MERSQSTFSFKAENEPAAPVGKPRRTFILPFVVLTFMSLPSLAVLAYSKSFSSLEMLEYAGIMTFVQPLAWLVAPLIAVTGSLYLIRGEGKLGRMSVLLLMTVSLGLFIYYIWPES